ncbi:uncharacterized protein CANTADRAFT_33099, partial [Suhomyces tanzawaensis NRRL Y-17324]
HIVKALLEKNYKVVGTVSSEAKGQHLMGLYHNPNFSYEIVPDFIAPNAFSAAFQNNPSTVDVFHTASPASLASTNFEE